MERHTLYDRLEPRNRVIAIYIAVTLLLTAIALFCWANGFTERHPHLTRFVYVDTEKAGTDLTHYERFKNWGQIGGRVLQTKDIFNYCPFAFWVMLFLVRLPYPVAMQSLYVGLGALILAGLLARNVAGSRFALTAIVVAVCTSYPFGFLFDRGNIEGMMWAPSVAGVYFFIRKNYLAAALLIALAASIKPFSALLFLLLLARRRYRSFAAGALTVVVISVVSLAILGPTFSIALRENLRGFQLFTELFVLPYNHLGNSHSLFGMLKLVLRFMSGWKPPATILEATRSMLAWYIPFCVATVCGSFYRLRKMPLLNQLFGIAVLSVLLPPQNFDYTLIAIYIPWAALLVALSRKDCEIPFGPAVTVMVTCAILLTSQYYLLVGSSTWLSGAVKAPVLLVMLMVALEYPLPARIYDATDELVQVKPLTAARP